MRNVIFLLVVINCIYFTWHLSRSELAKPAEYVTPPLPPDIRRLVTLQEQEQIVETPPEQTREIEQVTATQPPGAGAPKSCQALGPFLAESEMKAMAKRLNKSGLSATPQTRYAQEQVGYTVLLPTTEYEHAEKIKRMLEDNGIAATIIGRDNVVSLGVFKDKSQAGKMLERAHELRLDPHLEPSYAKRSMYWLVFQGQDNRDKRVAELARKSPDLRLETMVCP